jgi:hypothetical protein
MAHYLDVLSRCWKFASFCCCYDCLCHLLLRLYFESFALQYSALLVADEGIHVTLVVRTHVEIQVCLSLEI